MTYIKKVVMQGFKSFARRTEIPLENAMNVVVGPNGSGKCITGESVVSLGDGSFVRIDEIVNKRIKYGCKTEDGFMVGGDGTEVKCLDMDTLKVVNRPIKAFVKRSSPDKLLRIKTRTGKEIKSTKYHPFFILKEGRVVAAKAEELGEGTRIAVSRGVEHEVKSNYFTGLIGEIKREDNIYVPYSLEFKSLLRDVKGNLTWKEVANEIGVSYYSIKGLLDGQAIRLWSLIRIFKYAGLSEKEIIDSIDYILMNGKKTKFNFKNSPEFSRFFGYLLAEGRLTDSSQIWFTNGNLEVVRDYISLVRELFGKEPLVREYKPNCFDVIFYSEPLKVLLRRLGGGSNSSNKNISNHLFKSSTKLEISNLLNGLYCGDGFVDRKKPVIEITTKSEELARGIVNCLLRLGIYSNVKLIHKGYKDFVGEYFNVIVSGVSNLSLFKENVTLVHKGKNERLVNHLKKRANSNVDLIEANYLVRNVCKELGVNLKKAKKDFPRIDSYCYDGCVPSREGLMLLSQNILIGESKSLEQLNKLVTSDILWDEIVEFEEVGGEEWVYDLCVDHHHNFIANNVFAHNSNITDALCFVLGRLSIKSIRAARAANLLFSGNKTYKGAAEAFVELHFDNTDKTFAIDSAEVVIKRIVRKSGQSIYKINNKTKTRQELLELLAQAGIDPNGFNIVLQGEIQSLVKATSEDRRKIIEEVAGISIYETRKHKSLRELEKTQERLKEVSAVLRERNAYLKNLERERQDAINYQKLEKTISDCKATLISKSIKEKEKEVWGVDKSIENYEKEIDRVKKKIGEKNKGVLELQEKITLVNKQIQSSTSSEQEILHKELSDLKAELAGLSVRRENFQNRVEQGREKIVELKRKISELNDEIVKIQGDKPEIKRQQDQKRSAQEKFDFLEKERRKFYLLKSDISTLEDKKGLKEKTIVESEKEVQLLERGISELVDEIKYARTVEEVEKLKRETEEKVSKIEEEISDFEKEILEKEKANAGLGADILRERNLKKNISSLDVCPVCRQEVCTEHKDKISEDSDLKIDNARGDIDKNSKIIRDGYSKIEKLEEELSVLKTKLNEINIDEIKIKNSEEKKDRALSLRSDIGEEKLELKEINEKLHSLKKDFKGLKDIEEKYDEARVRLNELSFIDTDVDSEVLMKKKELNRMGLELKSTVRDVEDSEVEERKISVLIEQKEKLAEKKEVEEQELYEQFQKFFSERNELQDKQKALETDVIGFQHTIRNIEEKINYNKVSKAQFRAQIDSMKTELSEFGSYDILQGKVEDIRERLQKAQFRISRLGNVNMKALEVFDRVEEQCQAIFEKVETIKSEEEKIQAIISEIDKKKKKSFLSTLNSVNEYFSRNFSHLSRKGSVFLELENKKNPFDGGLNILVKVSRGKYFDIASLSGGEKTLVALALIFAIQEYKPYCFYIFDEIDAALDKHNSELLAALIKKYMKTGQYIIITHNDTLISEATSIYGVSMQESLSKIVSLKV